MSKTPVVFLSYNSASSELAGDIAAQLQSIATVQRYETDVAISGSFEAFMSSITSADVVVSIVSSAYLHSSACMYEGIMAAGAVRYVYYLVERDVIPTVYNRNGRLGIVEYWTQEETAFRERVEALPTSAQYGFKLDIQRLSFVRDHAAEFLYKIQDTNNTTSYRMVMEIQNIIKHTRYDSIEADLRNRILSTLYDSIPEEEKVVYNANKNGSISRAELEPVLGKNNRATLKVLNSMISDGTLLRTGRGRKVTYMLAQNAESEILNH